MWSDFYKAGDFRDRGKFMEPTKTADRFGNERLGFTFAGERWVDLQEQSAREISEAGAPRDTSEATLRVIEDSFTRKVDSLWHVEVRGERWSITGIKSLGQRGRMLEMTVEKGVAK